MNYVTTNIRIPEDDYLRLKEEAAEKRKSLAAVIREKLQQGEKKRSEEEVKRLLAETNKLAKKNAKYTKGVDGVKIIREMRYEGKW